jgi:hypothetical protein
VAAAMAGRLGRHSFELSASFLERSSKMESSITRPAVDIASDKPRPGLAFVLALLAVPGSTVAWDLPAGGLYIGLPLAIAAIVLGARAR